MLRFGVDNLRRLKSVPLTEIKPITILVGRNSSGKSSFLRALPLLRQSLMTRTSSPILWYGDYVDFGSFTGSVSDNDATCLMCFKFGIDQINFGGRGYFIRQGEFITRTPVSYKNITLCVCISGLEDVARIGAIELTAEGGEISYGLKLNHAGDVQDLIIDNENVLKYFKPAKLIVPQGSIFPDIVSISDDASKPHRYIRGDDSFLAKAVATLITPSLDKRMKPEAVELLALEMLAFRSFHKNELLQSAERSTVRSWKKLLSDIATKDTKNLYRPLRRLFLASHFVPFIREVNDRLRQTVSDTLYIGPARARSERYYRYQDLAVSEIDPDGQNFAMFLNSLSEMQLSSLSDWVQKLFGYRITLSRPSGHISINLVEGKSETNIVDTGYGVSQILPVLGQIWWAANRDRATLGPYGGREVSILAIEQPELHLHPAHQAYLADALVDEPRSGTRSRFPRTHFIVETHSETLVNRLGELVAQGRLRADDVQVLLFEPDEEDDRKTNVRVSTFGEEGQLIDWPYGFFQPSI